MLCPTRWTVRAEALHSILANYEVLQSLWEESVDCVRDTEMRSRIQGISACMTTFDFFFGVSLGELLLNHGDNLSRALQASSISAAEGQKIANMTVKTLQAMRTDNEFKLFWLSVSQKAKHLEINEPTLPRRRKQSRRYDDSVHVDDGYAPQSAEDLYRCTYFEALDLLIQGILQRFDQPGYRMYTNLEALLVKAANNDKFDEGLNIVADFYKDDINKEQLKMQLSILSSNISCEPTHELHTVIKYLQGLSPPQRLQLSEVCVLASLILVMLACSQ